MDLNELKEFGKYQMPLPDMEVLYNTANQINSRTLMEIGSARGCSSIVLGSIAKKNGGIMQCVEHRNIPEWHDNIAHYGLSDHVKLINKPSPWVDSVDLVFPLDYLLIDGNHSFRAALVDYHWAQRYVKNGGLIAFHDYRSPHNEVIKAIDFILNTDKWLTEVSKSETRKGMIVFRKGR